MSLQDHEPAPEVREPTTALPTASAAIRLSDVVTESRAVSLLFAAVNIVILVALLAAGVGLVFLALSPAATAEAVLNRPVSLRTFDRAALLLGASLSLLTLRVFGSHLEGAWKWARLHPAGNLTVRTSGLAVTHNAVLEGTTEISWDKIEVIGIDDAHHHDRGSHWRRFPLNGHTQRTFLFATDGPAIPDAVLIAGRPAPPNIVIVLNDVITLHNPHVAESDVAFPVAATDGMPARPPRESTDTWILFLRAENGADARRLLAPSGKVRALKQSDLPGLF